MSIGSFWEMAIKNNIGKLELPDSILRIMEVCVGKSFLLLEIKAPHLDLLSKLPMIHKDPYDRLLVCQAMSEGLTLITIDEHIIKYNVETLWKQ